MEFKYVAPSSIKYVEVPKDYAMEIVKHGRNVYSQYGEDGVIEELLRRLNIKEGWACEFGAWDGKHLSNTFNLIKNHNWKAVMIESVPQKFKALLQTQAENNNIIAINACVHYLDGKGEKLDDILARTPIPVEFDLLSIDIDSCDYHVWNTLRVYKPKIVLIEHSGMLGEIIQREGAVHKRDIDGSSSFTSTKRLGEEKGYTALCNTGNLFFLRNDLFALFKKTLQGPEGKK